MIERGWRWTRLAALLAIGGLVAGAASGPEDRPLEGFGANRGGTAGPRVVVRSLADAGPGTLREALAGPGPRRVVFDVAGTILLRKRLELRDRAGVTVDGATAPAPGITLRQHGLAVIGSRDVIVRHLRVRGAHTDGLAVVGSQRVVIDHCSVTDAGDENVSVTENARYVTVSWSLIGDTRGDPGLRAKGMLIANFRQGPVSHVSLHHNLFVNEAQRSPQVSTAGLVDIRNNVIRDWSAYGARLRQGAWGNVVNNLFIGSRQPRKALVLGEDAGLVHIAGNRGPDGVDIDALSTAATPFAAAPVTMAGAEAAAAEVVRLAGAWPRDAVDASLAGAPPAADSARSAPARERSGGRP